MQLSKYYANRLCRPKVIAVHSLLDNNGSLWQRDHSALWGRHLRPASPPSRNHTIPAAERNPGAESANRATINHTHPANRKGNDGDRCLKSNPQSARPQIPLCGLPYRKPASPLKSACGCRSAAGTGVPGRGTPRSNESMNSPHRIERARRDRVGFGDRRGRHIPWRAGGSNRRVRLESTRAAAATSSSARSLSLRPREGRRGFGLSASREHATASFSLPFFS